MATPSYYRSLKNSLADCVANLEETEKLLAEKEAQIKELKEQNLRFAADLDNFQKKISQDSLELVKYSSERIIKELLPVLDSLDNSKNEGDLALKRQLMGVLQKEGLTEISDSDKPFDPNKHEAIGVEDGGESNTIKKIIRKGYMLADRVIRPEMVILNKGE